MDTILFFCKKRGLQEPSIEPIGMRSHLLMRICLDVGQEEWFGRKVVAETEEEVKAGTRNADGHEEERKRRCGLFRVLLSVFDHRVKKVGKGYQGAEKGYQETEKGYRGAEKGYQETEKGYRGAEKGKQKVEKGYQGAEEGYQKGKKGYQRAEKSDQRAKEREGICLEQERQIVPCQVEDAMQNLVSEILGMIGSWEGCFCVYEDCIHQALVGRKNSSRTGENRENCVQEAILPVLWKKYFQIQEFDDYTRKLWVEELLPEAVLPHFVILGMAPCLPILIEKYADRMKSLRWILPENDCTQELQEFVEDFYTEYGLAIMLQIAPAGERRLQAVCTEQSNILDFTREAQVSLAKVVKGSIWLDMLSMEEKKRRIVGRSIEVVYISLKEKWKLVHRKEPFVPEM